MRRLLPVIALICAVFLSGCTATGSSRQDAQLSKYQTVYFSEDIGIFDQKYLPMVSKVLEQNGLKVVSKSEAAGALACRFGTEQSNVWGFRVHVSLWDGHNMLFVSEAKNNGFGTLLASDAAAQNLISSALDTLNQELQSNRLRTKP